MQDDGLVYDGNGQIVNGYTGVKSDSVCGINIEAVGNADLGNLLTFLDEWHEVPVNILFTGNWECQMVRTGTAIPNVQGVINLRTEATLVPDTRLPTDFVPSFYTLDIVTILEDAYAIEGNMIIQVEKNLKLYYPTHFETVTFKYLRVMLPQDPLLAL